MNTASITIGVCLSDEHALDIEAFAAACGTEAAFVRLLVAAPELAVFDALDEGLSRQESAGLSRFETEYRSRQPAGTLLYVDTKET